MMFWVSIPANTINKLLLQAAKKKKKKKKKKEKKKKQLEVKRVHRMISFSVSLAEQYRYFNDIISSLNICLKC